MIAGFEFWLPRGAIVVCRLLGMCVPQNRDGTAAAFRGGGVRQEAEREAFKRRNS